MDKPAAAPAASTPTERELEILKILWDVGPASVRQVFDIMRARENIAQNTVQTFLRMMEDKGLVAHTLEGRSFIYRPLYSKQKTVSRFLNRVFDGAIDQLVMSAFQSKKVSADELKAIEQLIAEHKRKQGL
jgi:BlaI family transcriptional regulator, penicillinase repressor